MGNRIVSVNGQSLSPLPTAINEALQIIRSASLPKVIEFSGMQRVQTISNVETTLRLLDVDLGYVETINILPADFGVWDCTPQLVEFVDGDACAALGEDVKRKIKGKIAVIRRGGCSFLAKGWMVALQGARGAIIVNQEESVVKMPPDSKEAATGLNIPVAMVRKSAESILHSARRNGTHVQFFDAVYCNKGDANYGSIDAALEALQISAETIMQLEIDSKAEVIKEDPLHRGGRLSFAWPDGTSSLMGEFLQFSSGPRDLPKRSVRILQVKPAGACTPLEPSSIVFAVEVRWFAVVERGHGCSFATKIRHAERAGASGVVIANDMEFGITYGKVASSSSNEQHHTIPVIMIPLETARNLRRISSEQGDQPRLTLAVRPSISALWSELDELVDRRAWPASSSNCKKLWKKLSKRHHPDKKGGNKERFEWLRYLYDNVVQNQAGDTM